METSKEEPSGAGTVQWRSDKLFETLDDDIAHEYVRPDDLNPLQAVRPHPEGLPEPLHLRALERPGGRPESSQLRGRSGLSQTYDQPR